MFGFLMQLHLGIFIEPCESRMGLLAGMDFVALHSLCWVVLLVYPCAPGLEEPGHCCCSCLEQVLPSQRVLWAAHQCAAKGCPEEDFWNVGMLFVWYQSSQTGQTQGKCPPHQFRPTLFLFPLVSTQKYEVGVLGISTCQSLMVFLLLSQLVFHCFLISV